MIIYEVKKGDSVFSVARRFGVPPSRIITDNFLEEPSRLVPGQQLVILFPERTYTVRGGDTLYSVARDDGLSVNTLLRNNPMLNGEASIFPGQVLNISYEKPKFGELSICGYAYPSIDRRILCATLPYLTYLAVFSYGIGDNGELVEPNGDTEWIIDAAQRYSTLPILVLTSINSEGRFSQEAVRRMLSSEALGNRVIERAYELAVRQGFGGIDVDIEYVPSELAEAYADFVKRLKRRFADMTVTVSLAPKYSSEQAGQLYEGHDYAALGAAADRVFLMTYEWGYAYGPSMAISPIDRVREVVRYAVSAVPPEKLVLGVPNYGYDWSLPYVRGERAVTITNTEAVAIARSKGADILFDSTAMTPYFNYYDRPETFSDAVKHEVWFENARSVESALELIGEYSLSGLGVWNIMSRFPQLWTVANSLCTLKKYTVGGNA